MELMLLRWRLPSARHAGCSGDGEAGWCLACKGQHALTPGPAHSLPAALLLLHLAPLYPFMAAPQGSGGTVDPASLTSGNVQAVAAAIQQGVQGGRRGARWAGCIKPVSA